MNDIIIRRRDGTVIIVSAINSNRRGEHVPGRFRTKSFRHIVQMAFFKNQESYQDFKFTTQFTNFENQKKENCLRIIYTITSKIKISQPRYKF